MKAKKILAAILAAATVLTVGGCSNNTDNSNDSSTPVSSADNNSGDQSSVAENNGETLTLKVLTHRTDRIEDGSLEEMTKAFEEANNCKVEYQGFTDYSTDDEHNRIRRCSDESRYRKTEGSF